jgi:hypothetical protein
MPAHHPDLSCAVWRKSSRSSGDGQNCVEVTTGLPGLVAVRDSKNPHAPALILTHAQWRSLLAAARAYGLHVSA